MVYNKVKSFIFIRTSLEQSSPIYQTMPILANDDSWVPINDSVIGNLWLFGFNKTIYLDK